MKQYTVLLIFFAYGVICMSCFRQSSLSVNSTKSRSLAYNKPSSCVNAKIPSYAEVYNEIMLLATANPDFVEVYSAQDRYGVPFSSERICVGESEGPSSCSQWILQLTDKLAKQSPLHEVVIPLYERPDVVISGNLHGDEQVGPAAIMEFARFIIAAVTDPLHLYHRWALLTLQTKNILLIPITNPAGHTGRHRSDGVVDPNRDFPHGRTDDSCLQSSVALAMNEIMQHTATYTSITFHGGMEAITYVWGSALHPQSISPDEVSQLALATALRDFSGPRLSFSGELDPKKIKRNQLDFQNIVVPDTPLFDSSNSPQKLVFYPLGRMNDVVYPVGGGMEDWMYAGSWDVGAMTNCRASPLIKRTLYDDNVDSAGLKGDLRNNGLAYTKNTNNSRILLKPNVLQQYDDANLRASVILVETADQKRPRDDLLGCVDLSSLMSPSKVREAGFVTRAFRMIIAAVDMAFVSVAGLALRSSHDVAIRDKKEGWNAFTKERFVKDIIEYPFIYSETSKMSNPSNIGPDSYFYGLPALIASTNSEDSLIHRVAKLFEEASGALIIPTSLLILNERMMKEAWMNLPGVSSEVPIPDFVEYTATLSKIKIPRLLSQTSQINNAARSAADVESMILAADPLGKNEAKEYLDPELEKNVDSKELGLDDLPKEKPDFPLYQYVDESTAVRSLSGGHDAAHCNPYSFPCLAVLEQILLFEAKSLENSNLPTDIGSTKPSVVTQSELKIEDNNEEKNGQNVLDRRTTVSASNYPLQETVIQRVTTLDSMDHSEAQLGLRMAELQDENSVLLKKKKILAQPLSSTEISISFEVLGASAAEGYVLGLNVPYFVPQTLISEWILAVEEDLPAESFPDSNFRKSAEQSIWKILDEVPIAAEENFNERAKNILAATISGNPNLHFDQLSHLNLEDYEIYSKDTLNSSNRVNIEDLAEMQKHGNTDMNELTGLSSYSSYIAQSNALQVLVLSALQLVRAIQLFQKGTITAAHLAEYSLDGSVFVSSAPPARPLWAPGPAITTVEFSKVRGDTQPKPRSISSWNGIQTDFFSDFQEMRRYGASLSMKMAVDDARNDVEQQYDYLANYLNEKRKFSNPTNSGNNTPTNIPPNFDTGRIKRSLRERIETRSRNLSDEVNVRTEVDFFVPRFSACFLVTPKLFGPISAVEPCSGVAEPVQILRAPGRVKEEFKLPMETILDTRIFRKSTRVDAVHFSNFLLIPFAMADRGFAGAPPAPLEPEPQIPPQTLFANTRPGQNSGFSSFSEKARKRVRGSFQVGGRPAMVRFVSVSSMMTSVYGAKFDFNRLGDLNIPNIEKDKSTGKNPLSEAERDGQQQSDNGNNSKVPSIGHPTILIADGFGPKYKFMYLTILICIGLSLMFIAIITKFRRRSHAVHSPSLPLSNVQTQSTHRRVLVR